LINLPRKERAAQLRGSFFAEEQGDGKHRLYGGGIRKASFLMSA